MTCKSFDCACVKCDKDKSVFGICKNCETYPYRFIDSLREKYFGSPEERAEAETKESIRARKCKKCLIREFNKSSAQTIAIVVEEFNDSQVYG
jgi:hypothetical protein